MLLDEWVIRLLSVCRQISHEETLVLVSEARRRPFYPFCKGEFVNENKPVPRTNAESTRNSLEIVDNRERARP